jgi:hypothetical protein
MTQNVGSSDAEDTGALNEQRCYAFLIDDHAIEVSNRVHGRLVIEGEAVRFLYDHEGEVLRVTHEAHVDRLCYADLEGTLLRTRRIDKVLTPEDALEP